MISVYKGVAHPWLCDVMGHMTTRHYVAMFDDASYHLLHQVFAWDSAQADDSGLGWADVKHVVEYQQEVGSGDLLEVSGEVARLGGKSITVHYQMYNLSRDQLAATLESTSVLFDTRARKAVVLPDEMRIQAEKHITDGSGDSD
jgi:acyl-CoA thioester hydrolase